MHFALTSRNVMNMRENTSRTFPDCEQNKQKIWAIENMSIAKHSQTRSKGQNHGRRMCQDDQTWLVNHGLISRIAIVELAKAMYSCESHNCRAVHTYSGGARRRNGKIYEVTWRWRPIIDLIRKGKSGLAGDWIRYVLVYLCEISKKFCEKSRFGLSWGVFYYLKLELRRFYIEFLRFSDLVKGNFYHYKSKYNK